MASSLCKSTVLKVYHEIMDDVVAGVRELFLEDGVDEQILQELKQSWETKLLATKAVDTQTEIDKQIAMVKKEATSNGQVFNHKNHPQQHGAGAASSQHVQAHQQHSAQASQAPTHVTSASAPTTNNSAPATPRITHHVVPPPPPQQQQQQQQQQQPQQQQSLLKQESIASNSTQQQQQPQPSSQQNISQIVGDSAKLVPIQITLPQQPGTDGPRVLTIQVPVSALQGNQLHRVLTGPVITATMGLPHSIASTLLQQHVNAAFNQHHPPPSAAAAIAAAAIAPAGGLAPTGNGMAHAPTTTTTTVTANTSLLSNNIPPKTLSQGDAAYDDSSDDVEKGKSPRESIVAGCSSSSERPDNRRARRRSRRPRDKAVTLAEAEAVLASVLGDLSMDGAVIIPQCDGNLMDTSDEDDEPTDEDEPSDEDYDNKDEEDQEMEDGGPEEEPLNSEDDVTDEDPSELFDTDNVVVCQYDKITRARNKWKFHLKDGIMNLNGEDYVFQKASGDAEW